MIIKITTPYRQFRITPDPHQTLHTILLEKIKTPTYKAYTNDTEIKDTKKSLFDLKITNGSTIRVEYTEPKVEKEADLKIERKRDDLMCLHDSNAMCSNCAPLDPWDARYHTEKGIKYLSFSSYKEMLKQNNIDLLPTYLHYGHVENNNHINNNFINNNNRNINDGDNNNLEPTNKNVIEQKNNKNENRKTCDHESNVTCLNCQEKTITLKPQVFRMIDHIEIKNRLCIDHFLNLYSNSLRQVFGVLIGHEENYERVPGGRKVIVEDVFEIDQERFPDGFVVNESDIFRLFNYTFSYKMNVNNNTDDNNKIVNNENGIHDDTNNNTHESNINDIHENNINDGTNEQANQNNINDTNEKINDTNQKINETNQNEKKERINYVDALIKVLKTKNLKIIGIIYTNIMGKNNPYILSPLEIKFIAKLQNKAKHFEKSINTHFSSKLVTLTITRENDEITINEYQISVQGSALVEICKLTDDFFVAPFEVVYRARNEYGIETNVSSCKIPPEYFVVKLTHGYKETEEKRTYFDWRWSKKKMAGYFGGDYGKEKFGINVLVRILLEGYDIEGIENDKEFRADMDRLIEREWDCGKCTFINQARDMVCEMCGNPK